MIKQRRWLWVALAALPAFALAHGIAGDDAAFVQGSPGAAPIPFAYLGAKHMVTGLDHLLYLVGIVFFLQRPKDILILVSLFAAGHSLTLIIGVLTGTGINAYLIDALIGLSVVYKAFENLGGFRELLGVSPPAGAAVFAFGLCHGLGLASKLEQFSLAPDGLVINLLSFNLGVELGQLLALLGIVLLLAWVRQQPSFIRIARATNVILMATGFSIAGYQLTAYHLSAL